MRGAQTTEVTNTGICHGSYAWQVRKIYAYMYICADIKHVCVYAPMYVELIWRAAATPSLVLAYMGAYAHVSIYIYVKICKHVCMHPCTWN